MLAILTVSLFSLTFVENARAVSADILITKVQAGGASGLTKAAMQEYIEIFNSSANEIDVTDWCLINKSSVEFICFNPPSPTISYILPALGTMTVASDIFVSQNNVNIDFVYSPTNQTSGTIIGSSDSISILNKSKTIIDTAGWTSTLSSGYNIVRSKNISGVYVDTDSESDFTKSSSLSIPTSNLFEKVTIIDVCPNIDSVQVSLPTGYMKNNQGDCIEDICVNMTGLQENVPGGYSSDSNKQCLVSIADIYINELLADAVGSDDGGEFIEIYNNSSSDVDLSLFKIGIGGNPNWYLFPAGSTIKPMSYKVFYNNEIKFTLTNSGSSVVLYTIDDQQLGPKIEYVNAKMGNAWALVNDIWQYTNRPSPGSVNQETYIEETVSVASENNVKPCAPNQYRNPETNRCRLVVTVGQSQTLTPCKEGQYRSEETNRCRNIKDEVVVAECEEGYERNPETKRCRKIVKLEKAPYGLSQITTSQQQGSGNLVLYAVGGMVGGYGLWEWRRDFGQVIRKIRKYKFRSK